MNRKPELGSLLGILVVSLAVSAVVSAQDWTAQADAPQARAGACVGLIGNLIYQAYGEGPDLGTFSTSVYQYAIPSPSDWTVLGDATGPSRSQGAQAVDTVNGRLYCVGGQNGSGVLGSVDRFTPATGWESLTSLPSPGGAGAGAAFVPTRNSIFLFGGRTSPMPCEAATNQVLRYDINSDFWSYAGDLVEARADAAVVGSGGFVYIFGGCNGSGNFSRTVERYDPTTEQSTLLAVTLPDALNSAQTGATASPGKIHITGGIGVLRSLAYGIFDVSTEQFQGLGPSLPDCTFHSNRSQHGLVYHADTQTLYAVSGLCSSTNTPDPFPIPSLNSLYISP